MTTMTAETSLTRAEAAYAHPASFQRGERVSLGCRYGDFSRPATVTTTQQHDHSDINRAHLIVDIGVEQIRVTVGSLLSGRHTITSEGFRQNQSHGH